MTCSQVSIRMYRCEPSFSSASTSPPHPDQVVRATPSLRSNLALEDICPLFIFEIEKLRYRDSDGSAGTTLY